MMLEIVDGTLRESSMCIPKDWCERVGDPRSELIACDARLQMSVEYMKYLEQTGDFDGVHEVKESLFVLADRIKELKEVIANQEKENLRKMFLALLRKSKELGYSIIPATKDVEEQWELYLKSGVLVVDASENKMLVMSFHFLRGALSKYFKEVKDYYRLGSRDAEAICPVIMDYLFYGRRCSCD